MPAKAKGTVAVAVDASSNLGDQVDDLAEIGSRSSSRSSSSDEAAVEAVEQPQLRCKVCDAWYDPDANSSGACLHSGDFHKVSGMCELRKCRLAKLKFRRHWTCCDSSDPDVSLGCARSGPHVPDPSLVHSSWTKSASTASVKRKQPPQNNASKARHFKPGVVVRGQLLGSGAFSTVYRCVLQSYDGMFAVKVPSSDEGAVELAKELAILERIPRSDFIIRIIGYYRGDGDRRLEGLVMQCFAGTLETDLALRRRELALEPWFEFAELLRIAVCLAAGVQHLHRLGFFHRDIKPANVLIRYTGANTLQHGVLTDFGTTQTQEEATPSPVGTRPYSALRVSVLCGMCCAFCLFSSQAPLSSAFNLDVVPPEVDVEDESTCDDLGAADGLYILSGFLSLRAQSN
jgi:Protein kinase domain